MLTGIGRIIDGSISISSFIQLSMTQYGANDPHDTILIHNLTAVWAEKINHTDSNELIADIDHVPKFNSLPKMFDKNNHGISE